MINKIIIQTITLLILDKEANNTHYFITNKVKLMKSMAISYYCIYLSVFTLPFYSRLFSYIKV